MNKILLYLIYLFQNKKKYGGRISKQLVDPELYEEFIRIFEKGEVAFKETGKISSNKLAVYSHLGEIIIEGSMGNSC
jgi:signal recognition particle subunit SEC65